MNSPGIIKTVIVFGFAIVAAFSSGVSVGWKFIGFPRGFQAGENSMQTTYDALHGVAVDTMRGKQQCDQQVIKVNTEVDRQREENRKILIEDREATAIAVARAEQSAAKAASSMAKTQIQLAEARDEMAKIRDACVGAGVPAPFFDVLNKVLGAEAASGAAGGDKVSGAQADH